MAYINSRPKADGFRMPGEFEPHRGTIMIWPERPGSWPYGARAARTAFSRIIKTIAESEEVFVAVSEKGYVSAKEALGDKLAGTIVKEIYVPGRLVNIVAK